MIPRITFRLHYIALLTVLASCGGTTAKNPAQSPAKTADAEPEKPARMSQDGVMLVGDAEISLSSFQYGWSTLNFGGGGQAKMQYLLDKLLEREALAQAATAKGFEVERDEVVEQHLEKGQFFVLGHSHDLLDGVQGDEIAFMKSRWDKSVDPPQRQWFINYDYLGRLVKSWGLSDVDAFIEEQRRELLAEKMRASVRAAVVVTDADARTHFDHENTTATIDAVVFAPTAYHAKLVLGENDAATYLAAHPAAVKKQYEANKRLYLGRKPAVRVAQIFFKRPAPQPGPAANRKPMADPGRRAADAAHARLLAGEDFAALARALSEDEASRSLGGDLGWRTRAFPGLGNTVLARAIKDLKPGAFTPVIATARGYYILRVAAIRQGDLSFAQVRLEIAHKLMRADYAQTLAREDAQATLVQLRSGKKIEQMFERRPAKPAFDPSQLPPELWAQLSEEQREELRQAMQPAASATPAASPAASGPIPAGPITTTTALPIARPTDVPRPKVERVGPFQRSADIAHLGQAEDMARSIFEDLRSGSVAPRVFALADNFVAFVVTERKDPDPAAFTDSTKAKIKLDLTTQRGFTAQKKWVSQRCVALAKAGRVSINQAALQSLLGDESKVSYQACSSLN